MLLAAAFFAAASILTAGAISAAGDSSAGTGDGTPAGGIVIEDLSPDARGGQAYRMRYVIDVPRIVYWRFKTDFDSDLLLDNKFIEAHRVVGRSGRSVVTEDRYSYAPGAVFRWKTTVDRKDGTLRFVLLNPEQCGQRFHYGTIRVTGLGGKTLVVQEAHFDFFGASFWARYPWAGGMHAFLRDTARWEQATVVAKRKRYEK